MNKIAGICGDIKGILSGTDELTYALAGSEDDDINEILNEYDSKVIQESKKKGTFQSSPNAKHQKGIEKGSMSIIQREFHNMIAKHLESGKKQNDASTALDYFQKALNLRMVHFNDGSKAHSFEMADLHNNIADAHHDKKDYKSAIEAYQRAFSFKVCFA